MAEYEAPHGGSAAHHASRIRTLVVDDEKLARSGLSAMLAGDPDFEVEECAGGMEAVRMLREGRADLVFLDVQMPRVDGFAVIAAVGAAHMPVVVFVTAFGDYAIQAFEACALDYVLKPVEEARLTQTVARAKNAVRQRRAGRLATQLSALLTQLRLPSMSPLADAAEAAVPSEPAEHAGDPLHRLLLRSGRASYYLDVDQIDWIESDAYYARIWTGVRSHLLRQSLNQLEARLDPAQFVRVHRSAIVNVVRVVEVRRSGLGRYSVVLQGGKQVALSKERKGALHAALRGQR